MFDSQELIDELLNGEVTLQEAIQELIEGPPSDPYDRALFRMNTLIDRGVDVEKHTLLRIKKTKNRQKLQGIIRAAKTIGMQSIAKAAKARLASL